MNLAPFITVRGLARAQGDEEQVGRELYRRPLAPGS